MEEWQPHEQINRLRNHSAVTSKDERITVIPTHPPLRVKPSNHSSMHAMPSTAVPCTAGACSSDPSPLHPQPNLTPAVSPQDSQPFQTPSCSTRLARLQTLWDFHPRNVRGLALPAAVTNRLAGGAQGNHSKSTKMRTKHEPPDD